MDKAKQKLKQKIISALERGEDTHKIASKYDVSWQTVAAYKAHITMGTY